MDGPTHEPLILKMIVTKAIRAIAQRISTERPHVPKGPTHPSAIAKPPLANMASQNPRGIRIPLTYGKKKPSVTERGRRARWPRPTCGGWFGKLIRGVAQSYTLFKKLDRKRTKKIVIVG